MKIQKVSIKQFKNLSDFDADIKGSNILLVGDNSVGKSSFMQFIEIALGKSTEIPIGAEGEGYVIADKDEKPWTFKVKFKGGKPFVTITSPDGMTDTTKSALANIVGSIDFDIDEFVQLSDSTSGRKKQVEIYKGFLPIETRDFISTQEKRVQTSYDQRTEINREAKTLEGYLAEHRFKKYLNKLPEQRVDTKELQSIINEAMAKNKKIDEVIQRKKDRISEITNIQKQLAELHEKLSEVKKSQVAAESWLTENTHTDISEMMSQKDKAFEINSAFEDKEDYDKKLVQYQTLKEEAGELGAFIDSSRGTIEDAIKDCQIPVDGLTFDSDNLLYNSVPVSTSNLSTSEIIEVGVKMKIASNPDFGILFIPRSESIGKERWNYILDIAKRNNLQVIAEKVERGVEKLTIELIAD